MTLLINETGNPLNEVTETVPQLGDLGEWGPRGSAGNHDPRDDFKRIEARVSRMEMCTALLKDGVSRDKIDGVPTRELWRIYKQRGLNKPNKKVRNSKAKDGAQLSLRHLPQNLNGTSHPFTESPPQADQLFRGRRSIGGRILIRIPGWRRGR